MSRKFVANFADHVHKYAVVERNRMYRKNQPHRVDLAHLQTDGQGIRTIAASLGFRFPRARASRWRRRHIVEARLTVVTSPSSLASFKRHAFPFHG